MRVAPVRVLGDNVDPDQDDADDWRFLRRPALMGLLAIMSIGVGVSFDSSPFKLEMPGTWFFGEPAQQGVASTAFLLFGLVAVYGGMVLLMRVWYGLVRALTRRPGVPIKHLWLMLGLWILPLLVIAPIFSRDVFSYAAQGEMVSHHINPYNYGPFTLGAGPYVNPVDPLWANAPAPYGPLFLMIDGFFASASLHHVLVTVVFLRLLAVVGVALIAYSIPKLARAYGRDPGPIFLLTALNPLVLLTLVGSGHNDAIMVGLLMVGLAAAKTKHPVWGVVLVTLAAAIKAPAGLGVIYIGWEWLGTGVPIRQRIRPVLTSGILCLGILALLSVVSGLGWGWVRNLETPGTVRSWLAPTTAIGLGMGHLFHAIGIGLSTTVVLSGAPRPRFRGGRGGRRLSAQEQRPHRRAEGHCVHAAPLRPPRPRRPGLVPHLGPAPARAGGDRPVAHAHHRGVGVVPLSRAARRPGPHRPADPLRPAVARVGVPRLPLRAARAARALVDLVALGRR